MAGRCARCLAAPCAGFFVWTKPRFCVSLSCVQSHLQRVPGVCLWRAPARRTTASCLTTASPRRAARWRSVRTRARECDHTESDNASGHRSTVHIGIREGLPDLSNFAPNLLNPVSIWSISNKFGPESARVRPNLGHSSQIWGEIGQARPHFSRVRPTSVELGPESDGLGSISTDFGLLST